MIILRDFRIKSLILLRESNNNFKNPLISIFKMPTLRELYTQMKEGESAPRGAVQIRESELGVASFEILASIPEKGIAVDELEQQKFRCSSIGSRDIKRMLNNLQSWGYVNISEQRVVTRKSYASDDAPCELSPTGSARHPFARE